MHRLYYDPTQIRLPRELRLLQATRGAQGQLRSIHGAFEVNRGFRGVVAGVSAEDTGKVRSWRRNLCP
uniref:3-ketoacyl-CoA synthase n=1 Tax=Rhizophora mucronata TaxID=61149 RepID=A0A2P2P609_RHIMU